MYKTLILTLITISASSPSTFASDSGAMNITVNIPDFQTIVTAKNSGAVGTQMASMHKSSPMVRMPNYVIEKASVDVFLSNGLSADVRLEQPNIVGHELSLDRTETSAFDQWEKQGFSLSSSSNGSGAFEQALLIVSVK